VPGAIARAYHEAQAAAGPALVVVPMGDWHEPFDAAPGGAPAAVIHPAGVVPEQLDPLVELLAGARSPAIVTGAGTDTPEGFAATAALAERLACPVWHEPFSARAGFPEDHPLFAGHLAWQRTRMRATLAQHDVVLVVGTKAFQLYILDAEEPPVAAGTRVAVVTANANEAFQSACELAVVAPVAAVCAALAARLDRRPTGAVAPLRRPGPPAPPAPGQPLRSAHVLALLAEQLPADAVLVEESPTCRPVIAVIGDGSAMFGIQALWSAAHYDVGVLFVVMANGAYGVMDAQAHARGGRPAWPQFPGLDISGIARALGCPGTRVETYDELRATLTEAIGGLRDARTPLLVEAVVAP
jgi:benzoylformate decarboxylase